MDHLADSTAKLCPPNIDWACVPMDNRPCLEKMRTCDRISDVELIATFKAVSSAKSPLACSGR